MNLEKLLKELCQLQYSASPANFEEQARLILQLAYENGGADTLREMVRENKKVTA